MVRRSLLVFCLVFSALPVWGATYYVRKDGSDSCAGLTDAAAAAGTTACAFATVQRGADAAAAPGDRVVIHAGTYFESVSIRVSGSPTSPTIFQGAAGETAVIDAGEPGFRTPGNNDWELVDASIGEYRSVAAHSGMQRVYGYITGVPGYENGRVGLIPYVDTRAEAGGGLPGFRMFRAATDQYTDPSSPFYAGPGLWLGHACSGGSTPGAACEVATDCPFGGFCEPTNRIHIRLSKTADMRYTESRYGTVLGEEDADPRKYSLNISTATYTMRVFGSYLRFENLTFNQSLRTINLEAGAHHLTFDGVTIWVGDAGLAAEQPSNPPHDITLTRSRVYGDSPYWVFWSDAKDAPYPALKTNGTDVHIAGGSHDWEISYNHIRGGMDGVSTNTNEDNIFVHHNRVENFKDDPFEIEGTTDVHKVVVYENFVGNSFNGFAPGQQSPSFTGPAFYYRNVVALLRDHPVNRKAGLNTFNGGYRYGHQYAFKQRSPNTFYYNNTVVLLNSHDRGIAIVPGDPGQQDDTYVFNNILVKVNRLVQGVYFTGSGQIVDYDLYWKMNTSDTDHLADLFDTIPLLNAATGFEAHGLGAIARTGTNPRFKNWSPNFDTTVPSRWALPPDQEVWSTADFLLSSGSPAIGAGMADPIHPVFGPLPDSRASRDLGALPYAASATEWSGFPFNQGWKGPFSGPDLVETAVSNLPAVVVVGSTLSVTDTVSNQGPLDAGTSVTRYYLSSDTVRSGPDVLLAGARSLPALPDGASASGTASVTIPAGTPSGVYYLLACADDTSLIVESNDANNCRASAAQVRVNVPDLTESAVGAPPPSAAAGTSFAMTDTASNTGTASARATTTRFYLSVDSQRSADDRLMTGTRTVPSLVPGASSTATLTVSVPATMRAGAYFVIACADDTGLVIEASETNNCAASPGPVQVLAADLLESAVTDPPSILVAGNSSSKTTITDTVINQGQIAAGSSTTRYYLSLDALKSANDIRLSATRPIAALGPGISSTGSVSATAPSSAPEGLYYLLACADDTSAVTEGDETNNCRASALQVRVTIPDLAETAMTEPPVSALVGQVFQITDTVTNLGTGTSKASTTRYYLSHNTLKDDADSPLSGSRAVPALAPGGASTGTINVSIPAGTASGTSFVLACADDNRAVTELSEVNNCRASTVSVAVTGPDLTESSLVNPPASVAAGGLFTVTDTTVNQGSTVSPATTTRYYLSADALKDAGDKLLTGARAVGPLQVGASVGGPLSIGIPVGTTPGNYLLLACCDDTNAAAETSETNNCRAGTTPMQVTVPDLVITLVGEPPPFTISGDALTVSETVSNIGTSGAAGSTTQYYFSVDSQRSADDVPLTGSRAVPAIASGASSAGTANVLPPTTLAAGSYYLIACADNLGVVSEGDETNNCRSSLTATTLRVRDLTESAVSNPPAGLPAGSSFTVTDTALNRGGAAAAGSTTRYYLAVDRVKTLSSLLLTGSRPVPSLAAGASSAGSATVGIPAGARAGAFFLLACADDIGAIPEVDETNNCAASSSTITVQVMDLRASAVSDPPATTVAGNGNFTFPITDTVVNQGQVTAGSSTTRYYLSRDTLKDGADVRLSATRAVPSLPPGASSTGTVTANANSAATEGFYFVLACADDTDSVVEGDETNNCRASASQVRVILPDMIESGVSASAGSVGAGRSFTASDTAVNSGLGTAKGSTTRYYLSIDSTWTAADLLLQGTRSVPGLAAAASSTGTASVTVPAGTAAGLYYFFACADDPSGMTESNETNNCTAAATRLQVTP